MIPVRQDVFGRDAELAAIASFLDGEAATALVLEGEPGAGKTTLLRAAVAAAGERGRRVLEAAPGEREQHLDYAALADLLGDAVHEVAAELAPPRRAALEVALMLAAPDHGPPDRLAVSLAAADALRLLARAGPILVAVDDVQWLDAASADALTFALRRLKGRAVLARRGADPTPPLGLRADAARVVSVGPLSIGALHGLLVHRIGRSYPRPVLHRLHETSGGNPFYAVELALAHERRGAAAPGGALPLPPTLGEAVRERLTSLPGDARRVVAAAALARSPSASGFDGSLAPAVAADVVVVEDDLVRFTHPLLRAAAAELLEPEQRRAVHAELAAVARDPEERARHLALSLNGSDEAVAATAEHAGARAAARGARADAAELFELASGVTPEHGGAAHRRRRLRAAAELVAAGDPGRARTLLVPLVEELPAGAERAEALFLLAADDLLAYRERLEQALAEAVGAPALEARIGTALAALLLNFGEVGASRDRLRAIVDRTGDPHALALALVLDAVAGARTDEGLLERALAAERDADGPATNWEYPPSLALGLVRMYADRHDEARELLHRGIAVASASGADRDALWFFVAELECRAGRYRDAETAAARALAYAERLGLEHELSVALYASALVDAHTGRAEEARRKAERAVELARAANEWVFELQGLATLGFLELSLGRPAEAVAILRPAAERLIAAGAGDPSVWVGALPNAIEALTAVGELDEARALLAVLDEQAAALEGSWSRARAARCHGLIAAAEGRFDDAYTALDRALEETDAPLERGRTLLALGIARRRAKQKAPAREALNEAIGVFEQLGAAAWAERGREELARVAGRRATPTDLTATERRVADLVAAGRSNKEAAAELFLSVKAVEANLSRVYRKLGVRTRTELAARARET